MRLGFATAAVAALLCTAACDITFSSSDEASNEAADQSEGNQAAQSSPRQIDPSASNPQSIARARELAAAQGPEAQRAQLRAQARGELQNLRFVVDLSDREIRLFQGERLVRTHPAAVGSSEWPTPTGEWEFHRVDLNPEWNPPDETWASEESRAAPGDPDNPMGRARLVYRMPNTVHGTDDLGSLGKAESHGSIRVANEVALNLAEILLKAGNAWEGPGWFQQMIRNRTTEYQVDLAERIPILVQE